EALKASRFLIVICSPYTPRSKWVNREIEYFHELGRSDKVLALLTEGEPGDSFPSRILTKEKEPLAADVRPLRGRSMKQSKQLALLRLIACILDVSFDVLRQRDRERKRQGRFIGGC